jgi:flagellar biosynthesis protein FlhF
MSVRHRDQTPASTNGDGPAPDGVRTYRGRRIEDIVPQIRAELGADAVILRQREGVTGGVGGFFAQRCVEVDARSGTPRIDIYDDVDEPADAGYGYQPPAAPSFAEQLLDAAITPPPVAAPATPLVARPPAPEPAKPAKPARPRWAARRAAPTAPARPAIEPPRTATPHRELDSAAAALVVSELVGRDLSEGWACQLIVSAAAHGSPFSSPDLRDCVRATLAASIPIAPALPASGAVVAIVGPGGAGKTRCAAALASAYSRASTLAVSVISLGGHDRGAGIAMLLGDDGVPVRAATTGDAVATEVAQARQEGLVVIDTAAVDPGGAEGLEALRRDLEALAPDAIFLAVPATVGGRAGTKLISTFESLGLAGIAVTHADETDDFGIVVELAGTSGLPLAYLHAGLDLHSALSVADAGVLARRLLP